MNRGTETADTQSSDVGIFSLLEEPVALADMAEMDQKKRASKKDMRQAFKDLMSTLDSTVGQGRMDSQQADLLKKIALYRFLEFHYVPIVEGRLARLTGKVDRIVSRDRSRQTGFAEAK
ncbi:MAG: hypothetical protein ABIE70_02005 [bacterium]